MRKLIYLWLACLLLMIVSSCKTKQKVVESVQYVHDTAFYHTDSVVYRFLTFNGTDEEKTATWTSHGYDSASGTKTDTIWKYRYRTIKGNAGESLRAETNGNKAEVKKDSTANTTTKANKVGVSKKEKKGGVRNWLGWLLFALLALIDIVFFAMCIRGKIVFKVNK